MLCTVGILPAMSQQQEKELQLNMDGLQGGPESAPQPD